MPDARLTRRSIAITASRLLRVLPCKYASSALLVLARPDTSSGPPAFLHSL